MNDGVYNEAVLPTLFAPKGFSNAKRLGRSNDGGYLIEAEDVKLTKLLLSLGVNDDWSFERDFCEDSGAALIAYDGSVGFYEFLKLAIKNLPILHRPLSVFHYISTAISYRSFFSGNRRHIKQHVGYNNEDKSVSMSQIFDGLSDQFPEKSLFLKVDIEGSEYRILDAIISNQNRLVGMAIEFHDVDLHIDRIKKFISEFDLNLVHIHANNYAPVIENGIPLAIECTFSRLAVHSNGSSVPHKLDQPNKSNEPEILFKFSDSEVPGG